MMVVACRMSEMIDEIMQRLKSLSHPQQKEVLDLVKSLQAMDKREFERKEVETDIDIAIDDQVVQTTTLNISGSGVYAYTRRSFEPGQTVRMVLNLKGPTRPLKLTGVVVRVDESGIGIEFRNISIYLKRFIDSLLQDKDGMFIS